MKKEFKLSELLYYAFFLILFTTRILGLVEGNVLYSIVLVVAMLCFVCSYLLVPADIYARISDCLLLLIAAISYALSGEKGMILFFAMMIGARYIQVDRLFKCVLMVSGISYIGMILLGVFGAISEAESFLFYTPIGEITRRSISNLQVNVVMTPYLALMMIVIYLFRSADKKQMLKISVLLFGGLLYLFSYCLTKTALIVGTIFLALVMYYCFYCKYSAVSKYITYSVFSICTIVSIVWPALFDVSGIGSYADIEMNYPHFMSWYHRLYIGKYYLVNNSISLLGQRLFDPTPDLIVYPLIHQSQLYLLLQYGVVLFCIVNVLHYIAIDYFHNCKDGVALSAIISYAIMGIAEPLLFNLSFKNITFVFIGVAYMEWIKRIDLKYRSIMVPAPLKDSVIRIHLPNISLIISDMQHLRNDKKRKIGFYSLVGGTIVLIIVALLSYENVSNGSMLLIDYFRLIMSTLIWSSLLISIVYSVVLVIRDHD